jgi:hypothetical protein
MPTLYRYDLANRPNLFRRELKARERARKRALRNGKGPRYMRRLAQLAKRAGGVA